MYVSRAAVIVAVTADYHYECNEQNEKKKKTHSR